MGKITVHGRFAVIVKNIKQVKKKYLLLVTTLFVSPILSFMPVIGAIAVGSIQINTCEELQAIDDDVNADYILTSNIDCAATTGWNEDSGNPGTFFGFEPIGDDDEFMFGGTFDGDGYIISNLHINRGNESSIGMFAAISSAGIVKDVSLTAVDITGSSDVGAAVGFSDGGTVSGVHSAGTVAGGGDNVGGVLGNNEEGTVSGADSDATVSSVAGSRTGGLVGRNPIGAVITDSHATGHVTGKDNTGGLLGAGGGTTYNSYATGQVDGEDGVGGLVGRSGGTIVGSYATGNVAGTGGDVGGLLGYHDTGIVANCRAEGDVSAALDRAGGLVGRNANSSIINSYATGDVTGSAARVGGLTGANGGTIENSYATGSATGTSSVGGLSGRNGGEITNSYAIGVVTGSSQTGGLVGVMDGGGSTASFWDTETSGKASSATGTGKTTAEMKTATTFTGAGWDDEDIWSITNGLYPTLFQNDLFDTGDGTQASSFVVSDCTELQNMRFLPDSYYSLAGNIDCSATAGWNNRSEVDYYIAEADGARTDFALGVHNIRSDTTLNVYVGGVLQGPEDYTFDYETGTISFGTAPVVGGVVADFSYYQGFVPVGTDNEFTGRLEGNNHTVSGLYINRPFDGYVGLFSEVSWDASVVNVTLTTVDVTGEYRVGGLVGENEGLVSNAHSAGTVTMLSDDDIVGGLVGANISDGLITSSSSSATVDGYSRVGGLTGANGGVISNSSASGSVNGNNNVGGLSGRSGGSIKVSHATGTVDGQSEIGGLVGHVDSGTVSKSYSTSEVTMSGNNQYAGGLVGYNSNGTLIKSYATGAVTGYDVIGGLTGYNGGTVSNSYATGSATASDATAGGLVGYNDDTIINSYSVGVVTGPSEAGGLIGFDNSATTDDSFWDTDTSGQATSAAGTGKTTTQMKTEATFTDVSWDFDNIWDMDGSTNAGYPFFNFGTGNINILVVGYDDQDHDYFDRTGYDFDSITPEEFAVASAGFFENYNIVIYEPDSGNYDALRQGLTNLSIAMESKGIVTSLRAAGNDGSQDNIDFLDTDFNRDNTHEAEIFADPTSPLLTGEQIDGVALSTDNFDTWNSTDHGWLENVPVSQVGYNVILQNEDGPSMIQYNYKHGRVLLDTLTSVDGSWGGGNDDFADNYIKYLAYLATQLAGDADGDGLSDAVEDAAPNGGDANNDGTPDSEQENVTSYINSLTGSYVVLETSDDCSNLDVESSAEATQAAQDAGYDYPAGLMSFTLDCGTPGITVTIKQYYYGVDASGLVARKFNSVSNTYQTIDGATVQNVTIASQQTARVTYQITDGGSMDEDGVADGMIVDPSGLGLNAVGAPNTGLGGGAR